MDSPCAGCCGARWWATRPARPSPAARASAGTASYRAGRSSAARTSTSRPDIEARQTYFGFAITRNQPIGHFRLVVDKVYPDNLVSFCGDGIRRVDGTRFEVTRTNFTPDRNIDVLILDRHPRR